MLGVRGNSPARLMIFEKMPLMGGPYEALYYSIISSLNKIVNNTVFIICIKGAKFYAIIKYRSIFQQRMLNYRTSGRVI